MTCYCSVYPYPVFILKLEKANHNTPNSLRKVPFDKAKYKVLRGIIYAVVSLGVSRIF